jgi:hypothetical protein
MPRAKTARFRDDLFPLDAGVLDDMLMLIFLIPEKLKRLFYGLLQTKMWIAACTRSLHMTDPQAMETR